MSKCQGCGASIREGRPTICRCQRVIAPNVTPPPRRIREPKQIELPCIHRSEQVGIANCGCAGKPKVHWCNLYKGHCTIQSSAKPWHQVIDGQTKIDRAGKLQPCIFCYKRNGRPAKQLLATVIEPWRFITSEQLTRDVVAMAGKLPPIAGVAGVPVSGMLAAPLLSTLLHVPLYEASNQNGLRLIGHGSRGGSRQIDPNDPILVIDDTVSSGSAMRSIKAKLGDGNYKFAAVYAAERASHELDYFGTNLEHPHLLEWNLANTGYITSLMPDGEFGAGGIAHDLDGVFCPDPPRVFDETDPVDRQAYLDWIADAPLGSYVPRMFKVPLIVSYRCEYTRPITEAWLAKHRINYDKLQLWPGPPETRPFDAKFKAEAYASRNFGLFIESDANQAAAIASTTGKRVLCLDSKQMINPQG